MLKSLMRPSVLFLLPSFFSCSCSFCLLLPYFSIHPYIYTHTHNICIYTYIYVSGQWKSKQTIPSANNKRESFIFFYSCFFILVFHLIMTLEIGSWLKKKKRIWNQLDDQSFSRWSNLRMDGLKDKILTLYIYI